MSWDDSITRRQLRMIWALKYKLGLNPDVTPYENINRKQARKLIDGLLDEVEALGLDKPE